MKREIEIIRTDYENKIISLVAEIKNLKEKTENFGNNNVNK